MQERLEAVVAEDDRPAVRIADHRAAGAIVLGAQVHGIGVGRIERDAVGLRHRQVEELCPRGATVRRSVHAAVVAVVGDRVRARAEFHGVMIHVHVAAGVGVRRPAVGAAEEVQAQHIDDVWIDRVRAHVAEPPPERGIDVGQRPVVRLAPGEPAVDRPVEPVEEPRAVGVDRVHDVRLRGAQAHADPPAVRARDGQPAARQGPGVSAVFGAVHRAAGATVVIELRLADALPHARIQHVRIVRPHDQIHAPSLAVDEVHQLPRRATVGGAVHAALRVRVPQQAHGGDEDPVGVRRVHADAADRPGVFEAEALPRVATIH